MAEQQIRFEDGAAYEQMMGTWSRLVGDVFLDWLTPRPGLRWIDIGCGSGAFTELVLERCAPAEVQGVDPSEAQLAFARARPAGRLATFREGDAMALPCPDASFDAAAMALAIFFVPDPAKGVAEMTRVVVPGGIIATYAWDLLGGGHPASPIQTEMRAVGLTALRPPSPGASRIDALRELWTGAGLDAVETREIAVRRRFADFDEFWTVNMMAPSVGPTVAALAPSDAERLKAAVRTRVAANEAGPITCVGRANAVKGRVPK
jgi:ubiquinone/menaquinone biosynthesis C-methylase UbiE